MILKKCILANHDCWLTMNWFGLRIPRLDTCWRVRGLAVDVSGSTARLGAPHPTPRPSSHQAGQRAPRAALSFVFSLYFYFLTRVKEQGQIVCSPKSWFGAKSTPNRLLYHFKLTFLGAYLELWEPPHHLQFQIMCLGGFENHPGQ